MRPAFALLGCAGCLSLGEPPRADCRPPRALAELRTSQDETGPWLSEDRLEILFTVGDRTGGTTMLKHATRPSPLDVFEDVSGASGIPVGARDGFIEADGRTLWFTVLENGTEQLFRATRDRPLSAVFGDVAKVPGIDPGGHPSMTTDGLTLFFHREVTGKPAVYRAVRASPYVEFPEGSLLTQLVPGALGITAPAVSGDGARLLFTVAETSSRVQIYETDLNGTEFEPGTPEEDVAGGDHNDRDAHLHVGGESIVFASDRVDGNYDLFITCE